MCKIKIGKNSFIPLFVFLDKYGKDMSNEEIGKLVRNAFYAAQEAAQAKKARRTEEGARLRTQRERQHISRRTMSDWIGVSEQTITNLEKGQPVQSPNVLIKSYENGLQFICTPKQQE